MQIMDIELVWNLDAQLVLLSLFTLVFCVGTGWWIRDKGQ